MCELFESIWLVPGDAETTRLLQLGFNGQAGTVSFAAGTLVLNEADRWPILGKALYDQKES